MRTKLQTALAMACALLVTANAAHADEQGSAVARPGNQVQRVNVTDTPDGAQVHIATARHAKFNLFKLENPLRVVVDIPDGDVADVDIPAKFGKGSAVNAITTTQFRGREGPVGRVVLVVGEGAAVDAREVDGGITIALSMPKNATPAAVSDSGDVPVIELSGDAPSVRAKHIAGVEAKRDGADTTVRIATDGEVVRYEVQETLEPARIVIDLFGVDAKQREYKLDGAVARARVGKHEDKVRVVLDVSGAMPRYNVASTGEGLRVFLQPAVAATAKTATLHEAKLERKNGFWRVALNVDGAVAVRTVKNSAQEKIIALDGVKAASQVAALTKGDGPIAAVHIEKDEGRPDSLRVRLELREDVEHSVWQRDNVVYWDARRMGQAPPVAGRAQPRAAAFASGGVELVQQSVAAATFKGKKITIDIMEGDIVNVIRLIGEASGKNVVVSEEVKGRVTIKLKNVPWDQALDVILKTKDLGQETRGGIIRVVPQAKLDAERDSRLKALEDREKKLPTTVRLIPVNYAVAQDLVPQVRGVLSGKGTDASRASVTADARTNVLIVEDIRENLDQAERLVRTLDTQTPQVLIEARMVEGTTQFTRSLGIQWGGGLFFSQRGGNPTGLAFPNQVGLAGAADDQTTLGGGIPGLFAPSNFAVNLPSQAVNSGVGLNLGSIGNFGFLNARLTAAEQTGQARVVSAPRVTTLNNKEARITQGTEFNIATVLQNTIQVTNVRAALELRVTPHVTADGSILMELEITNDVPNFGQTLPGAATPPLNTKQAKTDLLVRDGDTAVIGGIFTRNTADSYNQTPFLGSIPILGWLFKNYSETDTRSEMLVFITPRIVNRRAGGTP